MNYIINEHQEKLVNEIVVANGVFELNVVGDFYDELSEQSNANLVQITRKYFKKVVGEDLSKLSDKHIEDYLRELQYRNRTFGRKITKNMRNIDVISNLAYYLAKKSFEMKSGNNIEFIKIDYHSYGFTYFFFDNDLKELIGRITIEKMDKDNYREITKNPYKVSTSVIDKMMKSKGYGTSMYSTVIDDMGCLFSDNMLYKESLNIWVNVLPRYYNVGFINEYWEVKELTGNDRFPDPSKIKHYFACNEK